LFDSYSGATRLQYGPSPWYHGILVIFSIIPGKCRIKTACFTLHSIPHSQSICHHDVCTDKTTQSCKASDIWGMCQVRVSAGTPTTPIDDYHGKFQDPTSNKAVTASLHYPFQFGFTHSSKESYRLCNKYYEIQDEDRAQQRVVEPLMNEWTDEFGFTNHFTIQQMTQSHTMASETHKIMTSSVRIQTSLSHP
jgi:hypothetical protein